MTYTAEFKDIKNNSHYVNIENTSSVGTTEITLSSNPVTIKMEGGDTLYKPVKYSSCSIEMLEESYHFDLYSKKATDNKVTITDKNGNVEWIGYLTPNLYSTSYEDKYENITLEAIDGLSVLQYLDYTRINGTNDEIYTFFQIIQHILKKSGVFEKLYVSNNQYFTAGSCQLDELVITESNFYDEDDKPQKMKEVFESLMQYCNLTAVQVGKDIYLIDYDCIRTGNSNYYVYSIESGKKTQTTISHSRNITKESYAENGSSLELGEIYNKATVKNDIYHYNVIHEMFNDDYLVNYQGALNFKQKIEDNDYISFFSFLKNKGYKQRWWKLGDDFWNMNIDNPSKTEINVNNVNYNTLKNYVGCSFTRHQCFKKDNPDPNLDLDDMLIIPCHCPSNVSTPSFWGSDTIQQIEKNIWYHFSGRTCPVLTTEDNSGKKGLYPSNAYIVFEGSVTWQDIKDVFYLIPNHSRKNDNTKSWMAFMYVKLQVGRFYWTGYGWSTTESIFPLYFELTDADHYIGKNSQVKSNITYDMYIDCSSGYAIKMPPYYGEAIAYKPKVTLYNMFSLSYSHRLDVAFLHNFNVKLYYSNNGEIDIDSETEYQNVIDEDYVNEYNCDDWKVNTFDKKKASYSSVGLLDSQGGYSFAYSATSTSTGTYECPENLHIEKMVNQYSTPKVTLELNLVNTFKPFSYVKDTYLNKWFVIDTIELDLFYQKQKLRLVETA